MLSLLAVLVLQSAADTSARRAISFAEARGAAERLAGDVVVAVERVELSRAEVAVAGTLGNPTLTALTARQTAELGLSLSVPLPLFGQRGTAVRAAKADLEVARLEVEVARNDARW